MSEDTAENEGMGINDLFYGSPNTKVEPKNWMEDYEFTLVNEIDHLKEIVDKAIEAGYCALDLETTGLDNRIDSSNRTIDKIVGYCLSYDGKEGIYVPVKHMEQKGPRDSGPHPSNINNVEAAEEIKRLCENCVTIYHNSSFDLEFLYGSSADIQIDDPKMFEDTYILSYLRNPREKRHGLKKLSNERLGMEMIELGELFQGNEDKNFQKLDPGEKSTLWYAGADAICTYQLYEDMKDIPEKENMQHLYYVEKACVPAHRWMERCRPKMDRKYLERLTNQIDEKIESIKNEIYEALAEVILGDSNPSEIKMQKIKKKYDVDSPKKLGSALRKMKEERSDFDVELETTDSGQVATNESAIESLSEEHGDQFPFLEKIGTFRNLRKVNSTYVKPLLEKGGDWSEGGEKYEGAIRDNTARFKFNPYGTDSGRFSASQGKADHGYSGINVQSAPGCYNAATFPAKKINDRPSGTGDPDAELYEDYLYARDDQGLVRNEYDGHFIEEIRTGDEYCLRKTCEGCPFQEECDHEEPEERRFLSLGAAVRPGIVSRDDYVIAAIDYSGLEMRVAAEMSDEENWKEEFIHGEGDGHKQTAKIIYGDDVVNKPDFKMYRQNAKAANFAVLYGGGGGAIAGSAGISQDEGWEILNKMMKGIPSFRRWKEEVIEEAKREEEVRTCLNRKIPLPEITSSDSRKVHAMERKAVNSIIQGSATGDLIKYSMSSVYRAAKEKGLMNDIRMMFAIHDELVFELKKDTLEETVPLIREKMTEFGDKMGWEVPIEVEVELGQVWDTPHLWEKFKGIDEASGLAKSSVPSFLRNYIEFKKGMWFENEEGQRKIYDGEEFIDSDSKKYNWGLCHEPHDEKPIMEEPTPKDWIDHIKLYPGMWWKNITEDGTEYGLYDGKKFHDDFRVYQETMDKEDVISPKDLEESEQDDGENVDDENGESLEEVEKEIENTEEKDPEDYNLPIFQYKVKSNLNKRNGEFYIVRLKSVIRFLEVYARKNDIELTHELDVISPRGKSILPNDRRIRVNPDLFLLLAEYEGL
jgi:DNA polymerase I-like protein with 3'-5' exonuclease and polymerase domains